MLVSSLFSQGIRLDTVPVMYQLYPRDQANGSEIVFRGVVTTPGSDSLFLHVTRNGEPGQTIRQPLVYTGDSAAFRLQVRIPAEIAEYGFSLAIDTHTACRADSVVSGDAFVVSGQSNAVAFPGGWRQEYVRSFVNSRWVGDTGAAGCWEQQLGALIAERSGIPVAIINGAESATGITEQLPTPANHLDAGTMYGRLLTRVVQAGLQNRVRAMFFYQGENNTNRAAGSAGYAGYFNTLRDAWLMDYPALERIYVCQINLWNPLYEVSEGPGIIREMQRRFRHQYPNLETFATVGTPGYDGGHYTLMGYNMLGASIYPAIERDLYYRPDPDTAGRSSPDIVAAYFSTAARDRVTLVFNQPVVWKEDDGSGHFLKDYFALDSAYQVVDSGWAVPERCAIELKLKAPTQASTITYLHNTNAYFGGGAVYIEPVLRNSKNMAALTFHRFPIVMDTAQISMLTLSADAPTVEQFDTLRLFVRNGADTVRQGVLFVSLDTVTAGVSATGLVSGRNPGPARMVAEKSGIRDTLLLNVTTTSAVCTGIKFLSEKGRVLVDSLFMPGVLGTFQDGGNTFSARIESQATWSYQAGTFSDGLKAVEAGLSMPLIANYQGLYDTLYVDAYALPSIVKRINFQTQWETPKHMEGWINDSAQLYSTGRGYGWILGDPNNVVFGGNLNTPGFTYMANTMLWPRFDSLIYRIDVPAGDYVLRLCNRNNNVKPRHLVLYGSDTLIDNKLERDRGLWTTSRITVSDDSGLQFVMKGCISYLVLISGDGAPMSMVAQDSADAPAVLPPLAAPGVKDNGDLYVNLGLCAYPNPFNPAVTLRLPMPGASVKVYDLAGRLVADLSGDVQNGYTVWNAKKAASGVYFVSVKKGSVTLCKKIIYSK